MQILKQLRDILSNNAEFFKQTIEKGIDQEIKKIEIGNDGIIGECINLIKNSARDLLRNLGIVDKLKANTKHDKSKELLQYYKYLLNKIDEILQEKLMNQETSSSITVSFTTMICDFEEKHNIPHDISNKYEWIFRDIHDYIKRREEENRRAIEKN